MDAAAYITELLDSGNIIITPPDDEEDLMKYEASLGDWRTAP